MSVFESSPTTPLVLRADEALLNEAEVATVAFLARYSSRTLQSYRSDLRQYFHWCHEVAITPLSATRTHIELYRAWMDERGLRALADPIGASRLVSVVGPGGNGRTGE